MGRSRKNAWVWMVAAALAAAAMPGSAAPAADNVPKIGILDVQKILQDAPRIKQYMEEYDKLRTELGQKLEIRSQNRMLDNSQVEELIEIKLKGAAATEKDKTRVDELEKTDRDRDAELKKLQSTPQAQLSDADRAKLKELQNMQQQATSNGEALEKEYNSRLATKLKELDEKANADMQEAVNKVVEAKGLTLVLVKDAVKFGGTDITDDVINKLDRKTQ